MQQTKLESTLGYVQTKVVTNHTQYCLYKTQAENHTAKKQKINKKKYETREETQSIKCNSRRCTLPRKSL